MTEPDIIRIDGVEYEECQDCHGDRCADPRYICIRPKRKQTGRVCYGGAIGGEPCSYGPCIVFRGTIPADICAVSGMQSPWTRWVPFYGKVEE